MTKPRLKERNVVFEVALWESSSVLRLGTITDVWRWPGRAIRFRVEWHDGTVETMATREKLDLCTDSMMAHSLVL